MVLPSLSSDTLRYSKQWTNTDDKTESSDDFVIVMLKHTRSKKWTNTTRLNLVMVLPSLSLRHIQMFKSMDEYGDKTQSSDGFAIFIVTDTKCSTQWTNTDDTTESSDDFIIVMLKHTRSKQWTNMTRLNLVMVLPSLSLRHTQMFKAMSEYDGKTESGDGFAVFIVRHTHLSNSNGRI